MLSLCMIVRDEAATLKRCIESAQGVADEIIVVDTGSVDRTVDIAKALGADVHSFTWDDDFAADRNESLRHAKGDWILVLDADEMLVLAVVPTLRAAVQRDDAIAITLWREETGTTYPYSLLSRLFRNRPDIVFSRPYHESIDDSVTAILAQAPQWQVVELPGIAIRHTGYQTAVIAQRQKHDRARRTMERYLNEHPDDSYICSKLGALYADMGDLAQGIALLHQGLQTATAAPVRYELHYHLGSIYSQQQDWAQADAHFQQAVEQPLSQRLKLGAYNNWGSMLKDRGELVRARTLYQTVLTIEPDLAVGHYNLGLTLKAMGDLGLAIAHYERAIQLNPTYAEAHQNLGVALLKAGRVSDSLESFQRAIVLYEQQDSPVGARLRDSLQQMGLLNTTRH